MKIRTQFLILAFLLLTAGCLISALILKDRGLLFYLTEGVILVTLLFLIYFYQKVVKPIRSIGNGMELLREQDFSSRLSPVGQKDADRIVQVFNRMMEQLKDERLRLREQNHFLDLLISASPMGVIILDFDDHISMLNQAAVWFMGYTAPEELTGKKTLSDFATGHLYYGLHRTDKGWVFREWAPNATAIYLIGDFNDWKEEPAFKLKRLRNSGNWEITLPAKAIKPLLSPNLATD